MNPDGTGVRAVETPSPVRPPADGVSSRQRLNSTQKTGFYGVGVYHPKVEANVGTLWRSAMTYGAAFLATVGARYRTQSSDTCKAPQSIPLHHYSDLSDPIEHLPDGCPLVGIELSPEALPLRGYQHLPRALYLLGAEDHGLPPAVLDRCHHLLRIDTPRPWSLNVAVAGSLVMAHRYETLEV